VTLINLITGGSGYVGAELVHLLVRRGEKVIVFDIRRGHLLQDIESDIKFVQGDQSSQIDVQEVFSGDHISHVYHLGAMLTSESETNLPASFQTNVAGVFNVLEAARQHKVEKIMFTSSIGTFDPSTLTEMTDNSLQRPSSFYGAAKLYGEVLGRYYRRKFGLDFRAIRYPSVVGPGILTPGHWDVLMIESGLSGKRFESPIFADLCQSILYVKDAALAADMVLQAPRDKISMVCYNVGGIPRVSASEIMHEVRKYNPGADFAFAEEPKNGLFNFSAWNDSFARVEWGWKPVYDNIQKIVAEFVKK
jgi:threonine 3-dehydrogenase